MDQTTLEDVVRRCSEETRGERGVVEFSQEGVAMACISDPRADRMRIIAPIAELEGLDESVLHAMLDANFHSALDARYATSDGIVYAAYLHPLSTLTEDELVSAIDQVAELVRTFGTTFSSGDLIFGGGNRVH